MQRDRDKRGFVSSVNLLESGKNLQELGQADNGKIA
jgi:hypothetical protein